MTAIVNKRLNEVTIHLNKRGFVSVDGVFAKNISLHTIIKSKRKARRGYSIVALDITKAFDTLSHATIERALKRKGVDEYTSQYIMANYRNACTTISCAGEEICSLPIRRGTKQGDPMSLSIVDHVLDEAIEELERQSGISLEEQRVSCMAFADDLLVMAEDVKAAKKLVQSCQEFFHLHHLDLNADKCFAISVGRAPGRRLFVYIPPPNFLSMGSPSDRSALRRCWSIWGSSSPRWE